MQRPFLVDKSCTETMVFWLFWILVGVFSLMRQIIVQILLKFWQFHISLFIYFRYQLMILNLMYIFKQKGTGWWQKTLKTTLADISILPQCFFNPLQIFRQNLNKICHLCTTNEEDKFVFIRKSRVNLPIFWSKKRSLNNVIIY